MVSYPPLIFVIYPIFFLITLFLYLSGFLGLNIFLVFLIPIILYLIMDLIYTIRIAAKLVTGKEFIPSSCFPGTLWIWLGIFKRINVE
jgi:hypothetical protein